MRWNLGRHLRNANVIRKVVKGLHGMVPTPGATANPNSSQKKVAPKGGVVKPASTPKARVQAVTGGKNTHNAFGRRKLAAKIRKMRATPAGKAQLRSQVRRQP